MYDFDSFLACNTFEPHEVTAGQEVSYPPGNRIKYEHRDCSWIIKAPTGKV